MDHSKLEVKGGRGGNGCVSFEMSGYVHSVLSNTFIDFYYGQENDLIFTKKYWIDPAERKVPVVVQAAKEEMSFSSRIHQCSV